MRERRDVINFADKDFALDLHQFNVGQSVSSVSVRFASLTRRPSLLMTIDNEAPEYATCTSHLDELKYGASGTNKTYGERLDFAVLLADGQFAWYSHCLLAEAFPN